MNWNSILLSLVQEESPSVSTSATKSESEDLFINDPFATIQANWPQSDDAIPNAIANGQLTKIRSQAMHYPAYNGTIVSAYYSMKSKHSHSAYLSWTERNLFSSHDPMVFFCEPNSDICEVAENRTHAPTLVVRLPFTNFTMSRVVSKEVWKRMTLEAPLWEYKVGNGDVSKLWNEKFVSTRSVSGSRSRIEPNMKQIFLREVARANPFNTDHFFWYDAGYFRHIRRSISQNKIIVMKNPSLLGVPDHKMMVHAVFNESINTVQPYLYPEKKPYKWLAAGGFGGSLRAIERFYQAYYRTFWEMMSQGMYVGDEQLVMGNACHRFPSVCFVYYRGDKLWFIMAHAFTLWPQINETEISFRIPPLDNLTIPPKTVTHWKKAYEFIKQE